MMRSDEGPDRDLSQGPLDPALAAEERRLRAVLDTVREEVRAPASLREDVMRRVRALPAPVWRRVVDWCMRPRTIRLSPAMGALAMAAGVAALALWPGRGVAPEGTGPTASADLPVPAAEVRVVTRFVLVAPGAASVHLTGDFSDWTPLAVALEDLRGSGIWTADVELPPGVYQYTFVIDGSEFRPDPRAVSQVDDGFGQLNSVVIVSAESPA